MKADTLARIRAETADKLSDLPTGLGTFTLAISTVDANDLVEIFNYDSAARRCSLRAYFDAATDEYKLRVRFGLNEWCITKFFTADFDRFLNRLRAELDEMISRFDRNQLRSNSFVDGLKLDGWAYGSALPSNLRGFELFIRPAHPVEITNGSSIVINYVDFERERDLVVYYNIFSDEFGAEARRDGHTHVLYEFDARTLPELEAQLRAELEKSLAALDSD